VALALLIAIWGVFLLVALVRKRAEFRADSSIGAFQRQLQVLRRNSEAMDRSSAAPDGALSTSNAPLPAFTQVRARQMELDASHYPVRQRAGQHAADGRISNHDPYFRPEACARRRDVLLILVSAIASTGLVSIIPAARMALVLTAIAGVAFLVYVALLVRLRAQAFERQMKLRYMPVHEVAPVYADRRVVAR
jgi:hypothetical protein